MEAFPVLPPPMEEKVRGLSPKAKAHGTGLPPFSMGEKSVRARSAPVVALPVGVRPAESQNHQAWNFRTQEHRGGVHALTDTKKAASESNKLAHSGSPAGRISSRDSDTSRSEKTQLQRLVDAFAHTAIRGRPCKFVNSRLECVDTEYRLDSSLQYLLVFSAVNKNLVEVQCNIGRIQDIHTYAEDGPGCFHPKILQNICDAHDLHNLMMMTFLDRKGEPCSFCMLEVSPEGREEFLQSMRVLGIYAQQFAHCER